MEIAYKTLLAIAYISVTSCASLHTEISEVYVEDFFSDDMDACKPSDVDLNNNDAKNYFLKSRKVDYKVIHDHYIIAPCYIEGTMKFNGKLCDWKIQASGVGSVTCGDVVEYYVCDSCEGLFK